jgi:hypothetical protein
LNTDFTESVRPRVSPCPGIDELVDPLRCCQRDEDREAARICWRGD